METSSQGHWFEAMADHMGEAYLRYSFTKGTAQEVRFVIEQLGLRPGDRVLDVACRGAENISLPEIPRHRDGLL